MTNAPVALLFGGQSAEYDVSLLSAASAADALLPKIPRLLPVGIDREGKWFLYSGPIPHIRNGSWRSDGEHLTPVVPVRHGLLLRPTGEILPLGVVFPAVHGQFCEDGRLQGLLDSLGIPYVGSGTESSALCMNKALTKTLLAAHHIPTVNGLTVDLSSEKGNLSPLIHRAESLLVYPMFVKPSRSGSSVGAGKAKGREELIALLREAQKTDPLVIIERFVPARELEVAVLGESPTVISAPGELSYHAPFYDYAAKYRGGGAHMAVPAALPAHTTEKLRHYAGEIFRLLGCRHLARVDFFLADNGELFFNEINTLPGLTPFSMYPALMRHAGIPFPELLLRLLSLAERDAG